MHAENKYISWEERAKMPANDIALQICSGYISPPYLAELLKHTNIEQANAILVAIKEIETDYIVSTLDKSYTPIAYLSEPQHKRLDEAENFITQWIKENSHNKTDSDPIATECINDYKENKLPEALNKPEIIDIFNKLCKVQVRGEPICKNTGDVYHWEGSQALLGYFVHKFSEKFQLLKNKRVNWKLFQKALSFDDKIKKGAIKDYSESSSDGGCLHPGYKEINEILK